jgi:uncharacterized protein YbjT (DUF2867 family)
VQSVLVIGRNPCGVSHPKLRELLRSDFFDYRDATADLSGYDACFFCLGVSSAGMREETYRHLTYDLTLSAAQALAALNPGLTFCYVSGEGTDTSEQGRFMWARVKGKTENALRRLFTKAFMFRPGYIQPLKGVRSKTAWYQAFYVVLASLYPVLRTIFPTHMTTTENMGRAMIEVAVGGYPKPVLENIDINAVATRKSDT